MQTRSIDEPFIRLREYDSLSSLLTRSRPKNPFSFPWHKTESNIRLCCFDVHEEFLALGWRNGAFSIVERADDGCTHSFGTGDKHNGLFGARGDIIPTWLTLRRSDCLVLVSSCACVSSKCRRSLTSLSETEQSIILVYRIPLKEQHRLVISKMVRHVIKGIHHNPVVAPLYVSPTADMLISGDSRGSVIHCRYNSKLCVYQSYVLTVVPGSLCDLKLVQSSLLLLGCRAFPRERVYEGDDETDEQDVIEVLQEQEALHFLFDMVARKLVKLDLNKLLPPELKLFVSCTGIIWLPKRGPSKQLSFMCAVNPVKQMHKCTVRDYLTGVVAAVFIVHDQLSVSLERLILVPSEASVPSPVLIPVLTSAVSTLSPSNARLCVKPLPSVVSLNDITPLDKGTNLSRRVSYSSSLSTDVFSSGYSGISIPVITTDRKIALYSDTTIIIWFREPHACASRAVDAGSDMASSSSSTHMDNIRSANTVVEPVRSVLAFIQLNLTCDKTDPYPSTSHEPQKTVARLLAYTNRLGLINSLVPVSLRPLHLSSISSRWSRDSCANLTGHRVRGGGSGLEVWIHRILPDWLQNDTPSLVLLSTRPLCAPTLALSPYVDLEALFTDSENKSDNPSRKTVSRPTKSLKIAEPWQPRDTRSAGIEMGMDALDLIVDPADPEVVTETIQWTATSDPTRTTVHFPSPGHLTAAAFRRSDTPAEDKEQLDGLSSPDNAPLPELTPLATEFCQLDDQVPSVDTLSSLIENDSGSDPIDDVPEHQLDMVVHSSPTQSEEIDNTPIECQTDGAVCSSHARSSPSSPNALSSPTRSHTPSDDIWSVFACPSLQSTNSSARSTVELALSDPSVELIPFVPYTNGGRPVIAIFTPECTSKVEWVVAPKSFGEAQSLHVSPNGQIVWCLRKPSTASSCTHEVDGGTVDVCLDPDGVRGLVKRWLNDQPGHWEFGVLRRVVFVDLGNSRAAFITSSGDVKVQFGLSSNRPYCQSYTWPCPRYHLLQIAQDTGGLVWALAVTRPDEQKERNSKSSDGSEELCLLSAFLPDMLDPDQLKTDTGPQPIPTFMSPLMIKSLLKSSHWTPLSVPTGVEPTLRRLLHHQASNGGSLTSLFTAVNVTFQLMLITQAHALGSALNEDLSGEQDPEQVQESHSGEEKFTLGCLISTASQVADGGGCGFILPNLKPPLKIDDSTWYEVAIDCSDFTRVAETGFQAFMKRMNPHGSTFPPVQPSLRVATTVVLNPDTSAHHGPRVLNSTPFWVIVHRSANSVTLMKRLRNALTVYCWSKYRLRLGPRSSVSQQTVIRSSVNNDTGSVVWRFPFLIDGIRSGSKGSNDSRLWTLNSKSNELFCHYGAKHPRTLPIPSSTERDEVVAMCVVRDSTNNLAHLVVASKDGCLRSRLGISDLAPVGTTWVSESVPSHWTTMDSKDSQARPTSTTYCTSLVCVEEELWMTDSTGTLSSTRVKLTGNTDGTQRLLSSHWKIHSSPIKIDSYHNGCQIYFLSVSGASWRARRQGDSIWALGIGIKEAGKHAAPSSVTQGTMSLVYARCWDSESDQFVWSHVPAPPAKSIHVTNDNVWLVSNTNPRRIYTRLGLVHSVLKSLSGTDRVCRNLPAPYELQIGYAWQAVPLPDPILHTLNVDWFVTAHDRTCTNLSGVNDGTPMDALVLTQSGEWLRLRISDEMVLFLGSTLPAPLRSNCASPEIIDLPESD